MQTLASKDLIPLVNYLNNKNKKPLFCYYNRALISVNNAVLPNVSKRGENEVVSINNLNKSCVVLHSFNS